MYDASEVECPQYDVLDAVVSCGPSINNGIYPAPLPDWVTNDPSTSPILNSSADEYDSIHGNSDPWYVEVFKTSPYTPLFPILLWLALFFGTVYLLGGN